VSDDRVQRLDESARDRHPGPCGVEVQSCEPDLVTGRLDVKRERMLAARA
jgi:hypothetical protein